MESSGVRKPLPTQVSTTEDKYWASIELSNACRQFYKSRLEEANTLKTRWQTQAHQSQCNNTTTSNDNDRPAADHSSRSTTTSSTTTTTSSNCDNRTTHRRQRSSIDEAMDKLRTEMTSLMDQDLSLMKQLLTLNETIEDLKWQRRYYCSPSSSADLHHSDCSISDTEMYESEDDLLYLHHHSTTTTTTTTTASSTTPEVSQCRRHSVGGHKGEKRCSESQVGESSVKVYHGEQDSFDSGIHETCSSEEEVLEASV